MKALPISVSLSNCTRRVIAIHSVIFFIRSSIGLQHGGQSIQYWLRNWNRVWMLRSLENAQQAFGTPPPSEQTADYSEGRWQSPGFMKDCLQFWFLAQLVLRSARDAQSGPQYTVMSNPTNSIAEYDQAGMTDLKTLLRVQYNSRRKPTA